MQGVQADELVSLTRFLAAMVKLEKHLAGRGFNTPELTKSRIKLHLLIHAVALTSPAQELAQDTFKRLPQMNASGNAGGKVRTLLSLSYASYCECWDQVQPLPKLKLMLLSKECHELLTDESFAYLLRHDNGLTLLADIVASAEKNGGRQAHEKGQE